MRKNLHPVQSMLLWSQSVLKGGATQYKQGVPNTVASESILFIEL